MGSEMCIRDRDTDSDNDGTNDADEAGHGQSLQTGLSDAATDADGDGLFDVFEGASTSDGFDVNDENLDAAGDFALTDSDDDTDANGANAAPLATDLDYRDAITAEDDVFATPEDTPLVINPLPDNGNGADVNPHAHATDAVTVTTLPTAAQGVLTYTPDAGGAPVAVSTAVPLSSTEAATLTFAPTLNFNGTVIVPYLLTDENGDSETADIMITVTEGNDAPILDLNSAASDTDLDRDYAADWAEGTAPVSIADTDSGIFDSDDTNIESATITFTNAMAGDIITIGAVEVFNDGNIVTSSTVAGGLTYATAFDVSGALTITITATDTLANYADAIEQIQFSNGAQTPGTIQSGV